MTGIQHIITYQIMILIYHDIKKIWKHELARQDKWSRASTRI